MILFKSRVSKMIFAQTTGRFSVITLNNNISESKAFISETQEENYFNIMIIKCEIIHFIHLCNCMDYISCTIVWIIIVIINVFALQLLLSGLDRWGINWCSMAHWSFRYWEPFGIFFLLNEKRLAGTRPVKKITNVGTVLSIVITF